MNKILLCLCAIMLSTSSVALGYVIGNSNFTLGQYPEFDAYISYAPSEYEIDSYVRQAKEYVEGCNNDMQRIAEAREDAIAKANEVISRYNNGY